jgi:cell division protein FtsX
MALRHFQPGDPVGRHLYLSNGFPGTPYTVIGVVDDGTPRAFGAALQRRERVYLSVLQHPPLQAQLRVRTGAAGRRDVLARVAALAGRAGARTGATRGERAVQAEAVAAVHWLGRWPLGAGVVLVLVAALGLASTMHLWVESLRSELGIRRALGATRRSVEWYAAWRALVAGLAGVGVALVVLGTVVYPVVTDSLRGIPLWQPGTLAAWGAALTCVALAGALAPARRIARTAPARLFE